MVIESITLEVDDLRISGQLYLPETEQAPYPAVCICHGVPAKKPDPGNGGYPLLAERICNQGLAVMIFNFRGTGSSEGNLDILGWTSDLKAVIDYLFTVPEVDRAHVSLLGFSGGAAVSVFVASADSRISSVAACACPAEFTFLTQTDNPQSIIDHFRCIGAIRNRDFPPSAKEWFDHFTEINPVEYIGGIAPRPLLLVHGDQDETVPLSHARELYNRASEPKQMVIINGAGHRLRQNDRAMAVVADWLKSQYT
jgi:fermentation-respiration switch protein FrsA (DUF1100 family)